MVKTSLVYLVTSLLSAVPGTGGTFDAKDALSNALTAEGLIFVAFSLAFSLAQPSDRGRHPFFAQAWFGWVVVLAILGVALSAAESWWTIYGDQFPSGTQARIQAVGLALGIAVQPLFAALINWQARRS